MSTTRSTKTTQCEQQTTMSFSYTLGSSSSFSGREVVIGQRLHGMLIDIWKL